MNGQMRELSQYVQELVDTNQRTYLIDMEESQPDVLEVIVMLIDDGRCLCFYFAIT
jgi:hypothetical protein